MRSCEQSSPQTQQQYTKCRSGHHRVLQRRGRTAVRTVHTRTHTQKHCSRTISLARCYYPGLSVQLTRPRRGGAELTKNRNARLRSPRHVTGRGVGGKGLSLYQPNTAHRTVQEGWGSPAVGLGAATASITSRSEPQSVRRTDRRCSWRKSWRCCC